MRSNLLDFRKIPKDVDSAFGIVFLGMALLLLNDQYGSRLSQVLAGQMEAMFS